MSHRGRYWRGQLKALPFVAAFIAAAVVLWHSERVFGCVVGGVFVLTGLLLVGRTLWMSHIGQITQGTVADHETVEDCFCPVVEFRDLTGTTRRETTDCGCGVRTPAVGSHVVVMYDPKGKTACQILSFGERWGVALAVMTIGVMILALALGKG
jgi:predicted membrane protein